MQAEPGVAGTAGVSAAEFRETMGHFATGVTVVTSVGEDGEPVGTTANAVTSLSLDPPLLLVCFDLSSATRRAIRSHGAFVVNVLGHRHLSANFARRGLAAAWDGVRHVGTNGDGAAPLVFWRGGYTSLDGGLPA